MRSLNPKLTRGLFKLQGKIVRQESTNIDANLERKKKQVEIEKKMYGCSSHSARPLGL